jgi:aminopeptidase N
MFVGRDRPDLVHNLISQMHDSAASFVSGGPIYLGYRLGHVQGRGEIFRSLVYNKSAVVLHMLRRIIGDDAFERGLRRYYRTWRFNKAGTVDLEAAFEEEAGRRLDRFFERWILESQVPKLRLTSHVDAAGGFATIQIEQVGDIFDVPVTVSVQYADGHSDDVSLVLASAVTEQRVPLTGAVRRIVPKDDMTLATFVD